ncbi:surfeit locus protein 6 [Trichuris suis]|nr:surfeit locus protein 6 [Trichuris suis]
MSDHLKRILQLDAKFLRTLDMVDPSIYSFDETTKNYLRFADYKFKTGQLKKWDRQGVSKETERNLLRVVDCGSARTISRIWEILAESDPLEVASAAVKDVDIPDELLLGHSGNKDTEPLSILKTKMKVTSKGKGKQKGRKERKLRHAKTQFVAKRNFEEWPTPSHSDEGNMMNASTDELAYTKFEFASNRSSKNKHRKRGSFAVDNLVGRRYGSLLRKVEKRQEKLESLQQKDPAKAEVATRKICWDTAEKRAQGVKIKDDPSLLKKSLKRRLKKKERSRTKWAQRVAAVERAMQKKQEIRLKNIRRRIEQKKKFRAKEHL